jgi:Zn-finger nucleic acid-binding protein
MWCPTCKTPLTMSERQGIEIDYCPSCRGVWLDRGELDKIIERSAGPVAAPAPQAPPPQPQQQPWGGQQQHYGHDPRYRHKRRKVPDLFRMQQLKKLKLAVKDRLHRLSPRKAGG